MLVIVLVFGRRREDTRPTGRARANTNANTDTKTNTTLPTNNTEWGFWGGCDHNGYDQQMAWEAASDALATAFDLTPEQVRDLLDARFGRHFADDLSFIAGDPVSREAIEQHIMKRLADRGWRKWFERAVRETRSA